MFSANSKMACEFRTEIMNFINKYKGTDDINDLYREFDYDWLNSFDEELVKKVNIELDCVRNERIWGDGEYTNLVINDFITSLEKMLEN